MRNMAAPHLEEQQRVQAELQEVLDRARVAEEQRRAKKAKQARKKAAEVEQQVLKHDEEARAKAKEGASLAARAPAEQRQRKTQQPASTRCGRLRVESHKFGRRHPDLVLRIFLSVGTWVLILTR